MKMIRKVFIIGFFVQFLFGQGKVHIQCDVGTDIDYVVEDEWGRKAGKDPRLVNPSFNQIPNSGYGAIGFGGDTPWSHQFTLSITVPQESGEYSIKLIGKKLTKFTFYCSVNPELQSNPKGKFTIKSFLDANIDQLYKLTYDQNIPVKFEKMVLISTLGQDITAAGKLNLIGNQTYINSVTTKINQMVNFFHSGNKANAHNKLNDIKAQIQSAYFNPSSSQFVDEYAYAVLLEDIQLTFALIDYTGPIEEMRIKK